MTELDEFTRDYITGALWSSCDNSDESGGEPFDANYSDDDLAPETLAQMVNDCADFQAAQADDLAATRGYVLSAYHIAPGKIGVKGSLADYIFD